MSEPKRVLYVSSEIFPYMKESDISIVGRYLPQGAQERGFEIRSFMPKYGIINERRNQLHEVIRLSGMNIIIDDIDRPLIIKVSSIPSARMQVYFIDNEDYFYRKFIYHDSEGRYFDDNDERALFFAKGVLETVKKLRWKPDIVHCQGWISHLVPIFLRKYYHEDPIFTNCKIIVSLYDNEVNNIDFNDKVRSKLVAAGIKNKDLDMFSPPNGINLAKLAIQYANGVIMGSKTLPDTISEMIKSNSVPLLPYIEVSQHNTAYIDEYVEFYDQILRENVK
ncbi:MAG: glycogen/starch synthase [Bacteroidales bacterium]|jgi:starch synthase|nr:glycogen/starch synthase [Bacteroidales bacterium]